MRAFSAYQTLHTHQVQVASNKREATTARERVRRSSTAIKAIKKLPELTHAPVQIASNKRGNTKGQPESGRDAKEHSVEAVKSVKNAAVSSLASGVRGSPLVTN